MKKIIYILLLLFVIATGVYYFIPEESTVCTTGIPSHCVTSSCNKGLPIIGIPKSHCVSTQS
jgi:hypothetical protein